MSDLYEILGINKSATDAEVKSAYRKLARENHPDKTMHDGKDTTARFQEIQRAYDVLGDQGKRARYDAGADMSGPEMSRDERIERDARENLLRMIEEIIRDNDEDAMIYDDITEMVLTCIDNSKAQLAAEKEKQYRSAKKARIATRRLKTDNDAVKHHLRAIRIKAWQQYQQFKYLIAVGDRMDSMLDGMEYSVDKRPEPPKRDQNTYFVGKQFFGFGQNSI